MKIKINLSGQDITFSVPEGMDPGDYAEAIEEAHLKNAAPSAVEGNSFGQNLVEGTGRGAMNVIRHVGNLAGKVSDEELARANELDQDLMGTAGGQVGDFVGTTAATLPISYATGALGAGAKALSSASRLPKALATATASPVGQSVLESAATGALMAEPGDKLEGAAIGGSIAAGAGGVGKLFKRALTKPWATKTAEALDIEAHTGRSIPLSQSAEPGTVAKQFYEGIVANIPGAGGKLRKQYSDALQDFREYVVEEATPPGFGRVPAQGDDMQTIMGKLKTVWDQAYDFGFKDVPIKLGAVDNYDVPQAWMKLKPKSARLIKPGDTVTGGDLLSLKHQISLVLKDVPEKEQGWINALKKYRENIDDTLAKNFDPSGKGKGQLANEFRRYKELSPYYQKYQDITTAAASALDKASEFSPSQLLKATNRRAGGKGVEGGGAFNREAKSAAVSLKDFPSRQGIFQTLAALQVAGIFAGGLAGGPGGAVLAAGIPVAIGHAAASPKVQRALAGELPTQKALAAALRKVKDPVLRTGKELVRGTAAQMVQ